MISDKRPNCPVCNGHLTNVRITPYEIIGERGFCGASEKVPQSYINCMELAVTEAIEDQSILNPKKISSDRNYEHFMNTEFREDDRNK
jgi:hypothetical protein